MNDQDPLHVALVDAAAGLELEFETEYAGHPAAVRYRPAAAMAAQWRYGEDPLAFAALTYIAELVTGLTVDGVAQPVGRALRWNMLVPLGPILGQIVERGAAWGLEQIATEGVYLQRARAAMARGGRPPATRQRRGRR